MHTTASLQYQNLRHLAVNHIGLPTIVPDSAGKPGFCHLRGTEFTQMFYMNNLTHQTRSPRHSRLAVTSVTERNVDTGTAQKI